MGRIEGGESRRGVPAWQADFFAGAKGEKLLRQATPVGPAPPQKCFCGGRPRAFGWASDDIKRPACVFKLHLYPNLVMKYQVPHGFRCHSGGGVSFRCSRGGRSNGSQCSPGGHLPEKVAIQLVKVADGLVDPVHMAAPEGRLRAACSSVNVREVVRGHQGLANCSTSPSSISKDKTLSSFLEEGLYCIEFSPQVQGERAGLR